MLNNWSSWNNCSALQEQEWKFLQRTTESNRIKYNLMKHYEAKFKGKENPSRTRTIRQNYRIVISKMEALPNAFGKNTLQVFLSVLWSKTAKTKKESAVASKQSAITRQYTAALHSAHANSCKTHAIMP